MPSTPSFLADEHMSSAHGVPGTVLGGSKLMDLGQVLSDSVLKNTKH